MDRPVPHKAMSVEHGIAATLGRRSGMEQKYHQDFLAYWRYLGIPVKAKLRGKYRKAFQ